MSAGRSAVFLDRDGVLNENRDAHVRSWGEFAFLPGALEAVRRLHEAGRRLVVVTNQSAIGRGYVSAAAIDEIHRLMGEAIVAAGGAVERIVLCRHHPDEGCSCRKPKPGMLLEAARELGVDLGASYFVGDHLTDLEAARAAGCRAILVMTGRGAASADRAGRDHPGVPIVADLGAAADLILGATG